MGKLYTPKIHFLGNYNVIGADRKYRFFLKLKATKSVTDCVCR